MYIIIALAIIALIVLFLSAKIFADIANEKGFDGKGFFWWCFLFGIVGWAMVIALPDRGRNKNTKE